MGPQWERRLAAIRTGGGVAVGPRPSCSHAVCLALALTGMNN